MRSAVLSLRWRGKRKSISGLIRVRDGEEFLMPSIESIIDLVDEVVVIDNFSRDNTPNIIKQLVERYPGKVRAYRYEYNVVPVGEDSARLYRADPDSPCLAHNYSNWCLRQCLHPFVLKWDDDMIATSQLSEAVETFRYGNCVHYEFGGVNISSDFKHVLTWPAGIEPRIFPNNTSFSMFDFGGVVGEGSKGRYSGEVPAVWVTPKYTQQSSNPMYAHLKYCKRDPGSNQSQQFRSALEAGIRVGEYISEEFKFLLQRYLGVLAN
jgi:hypothetical protein